MLDKQIFQDQHPDEGFGQSLTPAYFFEILKRRALYFIIPFLLISVIGSLVTIAWPARYISQGTILVTSQEIPSDLVRPTVAALANDRIAIIQQRILTRDTLLALAKKYNLTPGWKERISGTELVDFIRGRIIIKPVALTLDSEMEKQKKQAIAFTAGFDYEQPIIATKMANDVVTMILNQDVQTRTDFATQTTKFMELEVKRLESQLGTTDNQIFELKRAHIGGLTDTTQFQDAKELIALKGELLLKSASYSDEHPDIKALKRKIEALEKGAEQKDVKKSVPDKTVQVANANGMGLDALVTQRKSLEEELNKAQQKLTSARLGESMERGQHSQRLEVIEQPTLPLKPDSPNKPKILAFVFAFALMASGGLLVGAETLNQSIQRSTDLYSMFDSHLIVSIPYIATDGELLRRKKTMVIGAGVGIMLVLAALVALYFVLPPFDVMYEKVMAVLGK
jgi:hypothetical protein